MLFTNDKVTFNGKNYVVKVWVHVPANTTNPYQVKLQPCKVDGSLSRGRPRFADFTKVALA